MKTNKNHYLLLLVVLGMTIISCKKEKEFKANGKVINKVTREPIAGVRVILQDGMYAGSPILSSDNPTTSSLDYTDDNGYYEVEIKADDNNAILLPSKTGYVFEYKMHETDGAYDSHRSIGKGVHEINIEMNGLAYFNSPFNKTSFPQSDNDSLIITLLSYDKIDEILRSLSPKIHEGAGPFTFYNDGDNSGIISKGDRYLRYKLEFTNNGEWQTKIDSVFLPTSIEVYRDTIYY